MWRRRGRIDILDLNKSIEASLSMLSIEHHGEIVSSLTVSSLREQSLIELEHWKQKHHCTCQQPHERLDYDFSILQFPDISWIFHLFHISETFRIQSCFMNTVSLQGGILRRVLLQRQLGVTNCLFWLSFILSNGSYRIYALNLFDKQPGLPASRLVSQASRTRQNVALLKQQPDFSQHQDRCKPASVK